MKLTKEENINSLIYLIELNIEMFENIFGKEDYNEIFYKDIYKMKQNIIELKTFFYRKNELEIFKRMEEIRKELCEFSLKISKKDIL